VKVITTNRTKASVTNSLLRYATVIALLIAPIRPAIAQLDIPGYVPCYPGSGKTLATTHPSPLIVTIHTDDVRQTIDHFGASDAWSIQFVGQRRLERREEIADLLFEKGLDENQDPKGIALSTWRFNIGAGSSRQSNIRPDTWRRADTFYNEDFTAYDWTRLPGQRWFLQAAKARGVEKMTAFVNSPPINMTKNGKAFADPSSGTTNLADDKVDDFARYLADILAHFRTVEGIDFEVISPINEPQWDWTGSGQEGSPYSTSDIKRVIDALAVVDLGNTRIEIPESGENKYLYLNTLDDYIDAFFDPTSPDYVGDKVDKVVAGHSYWTDTPTSGLLRSRNVLRAKLDEYPGMKYVMTEYSVLGADGPGRDLGIDSALRIARTAHFDLTLTEASSWQWWLGVSPYDYKDGLVYIPYRKFGGAPEESKMLWAVGNFSRFVRPDMARVTTSRSVETIPLQDATGLMVSSYIDAANNIAVSVFVNWTEEGKPVEIDIQGMKIDSVIPYVTSETDDLAPYELLKPSDQIEIPARSIVTLVGYHSQLSFPPREVSVSAPTAAVRVTRPGVIPVVILGEPEFDVGEIDVATLACGPGAAQPAHRSGGHFGDVNHDDIVDLVSHFKVRDVSLNVGDEMVCATGNTFDGGAFRGCDEVRTLP
jgi:O-glycosyl hydrolase